MMLTDGKCKIYWVSFNGSRFKNDKTKAIILPYALLNHHSHSACKLALSWMAMLDWWCSWEVEMMVMESLRRFGGRLWQWEASVDNKSTIASVSIFLLTNRLWHKQLKCSSLPQKKNFFFFIRNFPSHKSTNGRWERGLRIQFFFLFFFFSLLYRLGSNITCFQSK